MRNLNGMHSIRTLHSVRQTPDAQNAEQAKERIKSTLLKKEKERLESEKEKIENRLKEITERIGEINHHFQEKEKGATPYRTGDQNFNDKQGGTEFETLPMEY